MATKASPKKSSGANKKSAPQTKSVRFSEPAYDKLSSMSIEERNDFVLLSNKSELLTKYAQLVAPDKTPGKLSSRLSEMEDVMDHLHSQAERIRSACRIISSVEKQAESDKDGEGSPKFSSDMLGRICSLEFQMKDLHNQYSDIITHLNENL